MEDNDSNVKPTQTGGLKLMTVFIAVLALHVVVIGGITAYNLMKGGSADSDLLADKNHKGMPDILANGADAAIDKPATSAADPAATPVTVMAPTPDAGAPVDVPATPSTTPTSVTTVPSGPVTMPAPEVAPPSAPTAPIVAAVPEAPAAIAPVAAAPDLAPADGAPYVVKQGDSLAKIARNHGTTVAKLKAANNLSNDMLHIGQKLAIPAKSAAPAVPTAVAGTSAPAPVSAPAAPVAVKTNLTGSPAAPFPAGVKVTKHVSTPVPAAAASSASTYTVKQGDTLTKIARKFKTSPTALMSANNITDAAKLSIGQKLHLPGGVEKESRSASSAPAPAPAPIPAAAPAAQVQPQPQPQHEPAADAKGQLVNFNL